MENLKLDEQHGHEDAPCCSSALHLTPTHSTPSQASSSQHPTCSPRLPSQARNNVINVLQYFVDRQRKENNGRSCKYHVWSNPVTVRTIRHLRQEKKASPDGMIHSPGPRSRMATVTGQLDDFGKECVTRELLSLYDREELPTLSPLLRRVREPPLWTSMDRKPHVYYNEGFRIQI